MKRILLLWGMLLLSYLCLAQVSKQQAIDYPAMSKSEDLEPVRNLQAEVIGNDDVLLTWDFPENCQSEMERISWSGEMYSQANGYLQPESYEDKAHWFDALDLRNFVGWRIKSIGIIPVDNHVIYYASVWVKEGQDFVHLYQEPLTDTVLFEENIHELHQDIIIEAGKEYLIGYRVQCDPLLPYWSGYFHAADANPGNGKGNMMYNTHTLEWVAWPPFCNWCINATIVSPEGEMSLLNQKDEESLTGFRVYKDGQLLEEIGRRFQTYSFDAGYLDGETVTYSVTAMYGEMESEPVSVTFTYDGIENHEGMNLTLSPNPTSGLVRIGGGEADEIQVYNSLGQWVKTCRNTNEIDLSNLPEGVYTLRISSEEGCTTKRVVKM